MRSPTYYILDDQGEPVPCEDLLVWAAWHAAALADRRVVIKQDFVEGETRTVEIFGRDHHQGVGVSTVFLAIDHNFYGTGPPILWETMVFGTSLDGEQRRYASREAALAGHEELLARVRAAYELKKASPSPPRRRR